MEAALVARDVVGVQDFVLLEDFGNIDAFVENLRKRFKEDLIYVREKTKLFTFLVCQKVPQLVFCSVAHSAADIFCAVLIYIYGSCRHQLMLPQGSRDRILRRINRQRNSESISVCDFCGESSKQ